MSKRYTRKEISEWNTKDTVFVIDNVVYDVTQFLNDHPGGHEVLVKAAGADASEAFEDVSHSLDARELLHKFRIGELVDEDKVAVKSNPTRGIDEANFFSTWKFPLAVGLLITLLYTYLF